MKKDQLFTAIKALKLNPDEFIVIGSGTLTALGIRQTTDVDLVVSKLVFDRFEKTGQWERKDFDDGTHYLVNGIYEVGLDWGSPDAQPNLQELKEDQVIIDDLPFAGLATVRKWKAWKGTEKHLKDVQLIDAYLKKQG